MKFTISVLAFFAASAAAQAKCGAPCTIIVGAVDMNIVPAMNRMLIKRHFRLVAKMVAPATFLLEFVFQ